MKTTIQLLLALPAILMIAACGDLTEPRVTEGTQTEGATPMGETSPVESRATIVHVNHRDRVATLRNGHTFEENEFLIATDREGEQTGILKALPHRPVGLRIVEILEGSPNINDAISSASTSEANRLAEIYPDAEE